VYLILMVDPLEMMVDWMSFYPSARLAAASFDWVPNHSLIAEHYRLAAFSNSAFRLYESERANEPGLEGLEDEAMEGSWKYFREEKFGASTRFLQGYCGACRETN
jgi:hypothetical protein